MKFLIISNLHCPEDREHLLEITTGVLIKFHSRIMFMEVYSLKMTTFISGGNKSYSIQLPPLELLQPTPLQCHWPTQGQPAGQ